MTNSPRTAVIADPDPTVRKLLVEVVRRHGYDPLAVSGLEEAVEAIRETDVLAAIVDISLSAEGLSDLTSETRRKRVAVLVLTTGRIDRNTLEIFVSDDIFAVFPKPFDIEEILKTLDEAVEFAKSGSRVAARLHGFLEKLQDR